MGVPHVIPFAELYVASPTSTTSTSRTSYQTVAHAQHYLGLFYNAFITVTQGHEDLHEVPAGRSRAH